MTEPLFPDQVGFAIGTGRNGTHFLVKILGQEPGVAASHERNRLNIGKTVVSSKFLPGSL